MLKLLWAIAKADYASPLTACTPQYLHENRSMRLVQQKPTFCLESVNRRKYGSMNGEMHQLVGTEIMRRDIWGSRGVRLYEDT